MFLLFTKALQTYSVGIYATSRHIPGVRFAGISHPGLMYCAYLTLVADVDSFISWCRGTAPSAELLATWNKREGELIAQHVDAVPAVAFPPEPIGAYVGQDIPNDIMEKIATEGARTIPGREHGGNCDVSSYPPWRDPFGINKVHSIRSRTCREGQDATSQSLWKVQTCPSVTCTFPRVMLV